MAKFNNILILFTILLATFAGLAPLAGQERVWTSCLLYTSDAADDYSV